MRLLAACVLTLCLVVSGCGHDDTPASPIATTTTSPPANEGVEVPSLPAQAKQATPEGAASFTSYYVKLLDYAAWTGDTEELQRVSMPKCQGCNDYIKLYKKTYAAGGWFKGGASKLSDVNLTVNPGNPNEVRINANWTLADSRWRASSKGDEKISNATTTPMAFQMLYDNSWKMFLLAPRDDAK